MLFLVFTIFLVSLFSSGTSSNRFHQLSSGQIHTPVSKSAYACSAERLKETEKYICNGRGEIICMRGWSNPDYLCEVPTCSKTCVHGKCVGPEMCACELGWSGEKCDECIKLPHCKYGTCDTPFECKCETNWTGPFCQLPACSENCLQHGYCVSPHQCQCIPGWKGKECDVCTKRETCKHGFCIQDPSECLCEEGFTGTNCDAPMCKKGCKNGNCSAPDECNCSFGWIGEICDTCLPDFTKGCTKCIKNEPFTCGDGLENEKNIWSDSIINDSIVPS
uniref:EGF-like domain-containing protein n=1 Tax=Lepeophtheirus salmonis TaxID=72036 RepID=A0A0K2T7E1_LEPSM